MNMNIKSPESIGIFPKVVENHESKSRTNFDELKSFIASLDSNGMASWLDEIDSCEYCTKGKNNTGNSECTGNCMESILAWLKQSYTGKEKRQVSRTVLESASGKRG